MADFFEAKISGNLDAALDKYAAKVKGFAFVGAQAMAQTVYESAKVNAPVSDGAHFFYGKNSKYLFQAGTLRDSIYQVKSNDQSTADKAVYHVSWNHQKAPYGFMVEFGTSRAPAHPFLYPAYNQNKARLISIANAAMAAKAKGAV